MSVDFPIYISEVKVFNSHNVKHKMTAVEPRNFCSLTYRHSGKVFISDEKNALVCESGGVTFMPRGVAYNTEVIEDTDITAVHFNLVGANMPESPIVIPSVNNTLRAIFSSLEATIGDSSAHFLQMSILYELFHELNKNHGSLSEKSASHKITRAKEIIEKRFCEPLFSIDSLADEIGVSTAYLRRVFRSAYGISPIKYLKDMRIKMAMHLLLTESFSVVKVGELCGYSSTSYFIQDFHKLAGESPAQYRNRLSATP